MKRKGEQVISDSCNITNPFQSLKNVVAFSCRDWSANPEDAWIYGIFLQPFWQRVSLQLLFV